MNADIISQIYSLFLFSIAGVIIGIFFDIFRILRKSFQTPDIITYIEDIIFWIITGAFILFMIFTFQNGQIRNYNIIGIILGIATYILTISKYFIKINVTILVCLKKIIIYPIKILVKPITFIVINLKKKTSNFDKKIKNKLQKSIRKKGF